MSEPFLDHEERTKLIDAIAGLYDFTDQGPRGRRVLIQETAGLGRFVSGIDLTGPPRTVAADLLGKLERFGALPERPSYHALGGLLTAMLGLVELSGDDAAFIARVVVRYSLVSDPDYVAGLRQRFGIVEASVRPPAAGMPFRGAPHAPVGPAFDPHVADQAGLESIINSEDNLLDVNLLSGALYCAQAVGRVELPEGKAQGTAFLIGPDLILTNQHVLESESYLGEAVVRFGYVADASGVAAAGRVVALQKKLYWSSPAEELDYAVARTTEAPLADMAPKGDVALLPIENLLKLGKHRGYLALSPHVLLERSRVNILQHPNGDPLKVVLTQNYVVEWTDRRLQYVADTMEGSSGSPVFNHRWEVVALHHSGKPYPPESATNSMKKAWKGRFRVNEGVPIRAILEDFTKKGILSLLPRT